MYNIYLNINISKNIYNKCIVISLPYRASIIFRISLEHCVILSLFSSTLIAGKSENLSIKLVPLQCTLYRYCAIKQLVHSDADVWYQDNLANLCLLQQS